MDAIITNAICCSLKQLAALALPPVTLKGVTKEQQRDKLAAEDKLAASYKLLARGKLAARPTSFPSSSIILMFMAKPTSSMASRSSHSSKNLLSSRSVPSPFSLQWPNWQRKRAIKLLCPTTKVGWITFLLLGKVGRSGLGLGPDPHRSTEQAGN